MRSLSSFPKAHKAFDKDFYDIDVRTAPAAASPYTGAYGLELELEGRGLPTRFRGRPVNGVTWVAHEDGSLRNGGMEYVLDQPCSRADVRPLCDELFRSLGEARITNSTRCSTHVHLNMAGVKVNELASFVVLWGIFEDALSNYCGGHRSGNHFALRFSDCHWAVDAWINAFRSGAFRFSRERRYLALNAACLQTFGSLEVRTMRGVETSAEVDAWVGYLECLQIAAKRYPDPTAIAAEFSGDGALAFSRRIFGDERTAELLEACAELDDDFSQLVRAGFRRMQPIVYVLPWTDVLAEISKPYVPNPFGAVKPKRIRNEDGELVDAPRAVRPVFR